MPDDPPVLVDPVWPKLVALRDCLATALTGTIKGGVCRLAIEPGAVAWDFCSSTVDGDGNEINGQAWVRWTNRFPYSTFPIPANSARPCGFPKAVVIEMGIIRCVPIMDDRGNPPDADAMTDAAQAAGIDGEALLWAVCCASSTDAFKNRSILVGNLLPVGPQGACGGVTLTLTMDL